MDKDKKDVNPEFSVQYYIPGSESIAGSDPTLFHYEPWLNFMEQVTPVLTVTVFPSADSTCTKKEALAAYEKLDHTLCLNSSMDLKFGIDTDYHVDCNDLYEMIHCLKVIKQFIEIK